MRFARRVSFARSWPAMLTCWLLAGCNTVASDPSGDLPTGDWLDGADPATVLSSALCASPEPGSSPLRRLTNTEYENSLVALGFSAEEVALAVTTLPNEPESLGFRNGATALSVTSLLAEKYQAIAERLTRNYAYPCPENTSESECADDMIRRVGSLAHRRPLTPEETAEYRAIYDKARALDGHDDATGWVLQAMLQSPHFLYRVEIPDAGNVRPVTGYEMATRLSYTLWRSPPDERLWQAAEQGQLETKAQVLAQAKRMLGDPRALRVLDFFEQWLDLDELVSLDRDPDLYPGLSSNLPVLLRAETTAFLQSLLGDPDATFTDLLTADFTFANAELAEHYGIGPVEGDAFTLVPAPERRGILTQGMLVVHDGASRTSIVRRGLKMRTDFLCQLVPAPPDTVDLTLDGIGAELTQAERLALHRESAACSPCHMLMDPLGSAFEAFDAVGRFRTADEYGSPVDTQGEITGTLDADGPVDGVSELAERLAQSTDAKQCYLIQNFRYFYGRDAKREDLCSQAQLAAHFEGHGMRLAELLVGITQTDAFLYKAPRQPDPGGMP